MFNGNADEFIGYVAHDEKELMQAIISGFDLVCETRRDFPKYFRKRK